MIFDYTPNKEDLMMSANFVKFAKDLSKNQKTLFEEDDKQNRLAERQNLKGTVAFKRNKQGNVVMNERVLVVSLDEELNDELEPETIEFISIEFNNGNYDTLLLQSFMISSKF